MLFQTQIAHAAWTIQEGENAGCIKEIQFDTLDTRILTGAAGQSVKPVGFMNEDLVYGVVMDGDALTDDDGHVTEGIHTLRIEGFDGEIKKEYHGGRPVRDQCDDRKFT